MKAFSNLMLTSINFQIGEIVFLHKFNRLQGASIFKRIKMASDKSRMECFKNKGKDQDVSILILNITQSRVVEMQYYCCGI